MKPVDLKNPVWRRRFWATLTFVSIVLLAAHPELRLLVPLIDAIGLDLFIALIGFQLTQLLSSALAPVFHRAWGWSVPAIRAAHRVTYFIQPFRFVRDFARHALFHWTGKIGPSAWRRTHTLVRLARLGPRRAFAGA